MTTTLTSEPVAGLLRRLYEDARRSGEDFNRRMSELSASERAAMEHDSRAYYAAARTLYLAVSPETGRLLYTLVRARRARAVVEFGTSFGVSAISMAAALRDNPKPAAAADGREPGLPRLIGSEYEPSKAEAARASLAEAGLGDLVEVRVGDALETLAPDTLPAPVDLLFLDGAKDRYLDVLKLVEPALAPDALIVADNASRAPALLDHLRSSRDFLPVGGVQRDVEIALRSV
ncbi:O-methyltransferase [Phaeacidiphilus oryzae]|uniref:O-methyltransferase n=1 Tax=Phaeacidiphilus oryzae TaxID=348818 RepID=UPI00055B220F|nr:class I SAM-dependent methyltransferase [Phaeacidiphilus oryzae]